MIDGRQADRPQDAIRHRARARDLQEVAAAGVQVEGDHCKLQTAEFCIQKQLVKLRFLL
jgi:hypothetical protein